MASNENPIVKYRKLRIAWAVGCGIACLLLIALWVRSYTALESWQGRAGGGVAHIQMARGRVVYFKLSRLHDPGYYRVPFKNFGATTELERPIVGSMTRCKVLGKTMPIFVLPFWSLALCIAIAAAINVAPWLRWRFSLRTLLIGISVLAVVIGGLATIYHLRR
jgi:hypothetical protein